MTPIRLALLIAPLLFSNFSLAATEADGMVLQVQATGETQDFSNYADPDSPYAHTEDGRLISKDVKKTRIYVVVDKSGSMDIYSRNAAAAAQALVRGLDDKQCAEYEIRVVEMGNPEHEAGHMILNEEFITQDTRNGMDYLYRLMTYQRRLDVGHEAPLTSLMDAIQHDLGTFEDVDLVASIFLTDTVILHESQDALKLPESIQAMTGKPFTAYSLNLFSDTDYRVCRQDVYGGNDEIREITNFRRECVYAGYDERTCEIELLNRHFSEIQALVLNDPNLQWVDALINFTNASGGSSMNLCSNNFDFEFMAITNAILEKMGCQLYYLSEDLDAAREQKDTRFL